MNEHEPCGGVISRDGDGNILHIYACEVHLFDPGTCLWEENRRKKQNLPGQRGRESPNRGDST